MASPHLTETHWKIRKTKMFHSARHAHVKKIRKNEDFFFPIIGVEKKNILLKNKFSVIDVEKKNVIFGFFFIFP